MRRTRTLTMALLLTAALVAAPGSAKAKSAKVKGEVIKVEQHVRTENGGEFDRLTIRTRNRQELHLNLGPGGACDGCYQVGDQVRARTSGGPGSPGGHQVQSMEVRRNGRIFGYANQGGRMVQTGARGSRGAGGGDRVRDRVHEPGSAGCVGCRAGQGGQRGGAGRGSGGGRGGGKG